METRGHSLCQFRLNWNLCGWELSSSLFSLPWKHYLLSVLQLKSTREHLFRAHGLIPPRVASSEFSSKFRQGLCAFRQWITSTDAMAYSFPKSFPIIPNICPVFSAGQHGTQPGLTVRKASMLTGPLLTRFQLNMLSSGLKHCNIEAGACLELFQGKSAACVLELIGFQVLELVLWWYHALQISRITASYVSTLLADNDILKFVPNKSWSF